jgi:hypothetical protein
MVIILCSNWKWFPIPIPLHPPSQLRCHWLREHWAMDSVVAGHRWHRESLYNLAQRAHRPPVADLSCQGSRYVLQIASGLQTTTTFCLILCIGSYRCYATTLDLVLSAILKFGRCILTALSQTLRQELPSQRFAIAHTSPSSVVEDTEFSKEASAPYHVC